MVKCRSGYDHVLLVQYLVPLLYEAKQNPKLEKKGNKVSVISTKIQIKFRDVAKMLAPSTNLRTFGRLFNLKQEKAHFPFSALTSVSSLALPQLPTDPAQWHSELTGVRQSPEQISRIIAEAQEMFVKANCQNMGEYLRVYLLLDVDILYMATQEWRRHLKRLIGLDFVAVEKFTISSLAYTAGLKHMEANHRLGNFFPNNDQLYRLLRQGMRGLVVAAAYYICCQLLCTFFSNRSTYLGVFVPSFEARPVNLRPWLRRRALPNASLAITYPVLLAWAMTAIKTTSTTT